MTKISFAKNIFASFATSCLAFVVLEDLQHRGNIKPAPLSKTKKLTIDCVGFLFGRKVMETSGCFAISIKDDIGEYSVKWEGKWGAENWGF